MEDTTFKKTVSQALRTTLQGISYLNQAFRGNIQNEQHQKDNSNSKIVAQQNYMHSNKKFSFSDNLEYLKNLTLKNKREKKKQFIDLETFQNKEKPLSPYFLFLREKRENIKKNYPELQKEEVMLVMEQVWNSLKQSDKNQYIKQLARQKKEFDKRIQKYYSNLIEQDKKPERKKMKKVNKLTLNKPKSSKSRQNQKEKKSRKIILNKQFLIDD